MLNVAIIMGRLTRDPELRRTNSGKPVASFTVAVDRDFAPQGQDKETDFIDCVAWNATAEFVSKYFSKGSMVVVNGRLQIRSWTDNDGNKRRTAEIIANNCYFGESKRSQEGPGSQARPSYQNQRPQNFGGYAQAPQGDGQPQYNQQGFGGYQMPQGQFVPVSDEDAKLPF